MAFSNARRCRATAPQKCVTIWPLGKKICHLITPLGARMQALQEAKEGAGDGQSGSESDEAPTAKKRAARRSSGRRAVRGGRRRKADADADEGAIDVRAGPLLACLSASNLGSSTMIVAV